MRVTRMKINVLLMSDVDTIHHIEIYINGHNSIAFASARLRTRFDAKTDKKLSYRRLTDRAMHRTPQNRRGCITFWHPNAL